MEEHADDFLPEEDPFPPRIRRRVTCPKCGQHHQRRTPCRPRLDLSSDEDGERVPGPAEAPPGDIIGDVPQPIQHVPPPILARAGLGAVNVEFDDEIIDGAIADPLQEDDDGVPEPMPVNRDGVAAAPRWEEYPILPNALPLDAGGRVQFPKPPFGGPPRGACNIPDDCVRPVDYYRLYFNTTVYENGIANQFTRCINVYGRFFYTDRWRPMVINEFYKFFALITYGGIVKIPQYRNLWARSKPYAMLYGRNFVREAMSAHRFRQLWRCLHYVDASRMTVQQRYLANRGDAFWSVSPFCDQLSAKFEYYFNCGQFVDVDEMCIFYKGRHSCRVYNPSKPNKYHLKAFCLNDAETGYTKKYYMYRGKEEQRPADVSATEYPVRKLSTALSQHVNHIVGLDNWYTSMSICLFLLHLGIHVVGTVKTNRAGLPAEGKFPYKGPGVKARGFTKIMKTSTIGPVYLTAWQDSKPVHILSTFAPFQCQTSRRGRINGRFDRIDIPMPSTVATYNQAMGGTDLCDQYASYYEFEHRTNKWHRRIFTHFSVVAMRNAHMLYLTDPKNEDRATTKSFRIFCEMVICETLGLELPSFDPNVELREEDDPPSEEDRSIDEDSSESEDSDPEAGYFEDPLRPLAPALPRPTTSRKWWLGEQGMLRRLNGRDHWPVLTPKQVKVCTMVERQRVEYRSDTRLCCYVCLRKTTSKCASCQVSLCVVGETRMENCFWRFHNLDTFLHDA